MQTKTMRLHLSRRQILSLSVVGLGTLVVGRVAMIQAAEKLDENDTMAQNLNYRHDAKQANNSQRTADQVCRSCLHFQGKADAAWGPCPIFSGKEVNANGWCNVWAKKS